ncbi:MAG: ATP-binding protein [Chloroflexota bacterium]
MTVVGVTLPHAAQRELAALTRDPRVAEALRETPGSFPVLEAAFAVDPDAAPQAEPELGLHLVSWANLQPEEVRWLPGGCIPADGLTIIAGDGGIGKTRGVMSQAAAVTRRQRWPKFAPTCPDGEEWTNGPTGVLVCAGEDAVQTTLLPAFLSAGGDKRNVQSIESVFVPRRDGKGHREAGFDLSEPAMEALDRELETGKHAEVIIDGLTGYVQGDGKGDTETRRSLMPLARLLRKHSVSGIGLMHFGKASKRASDKLIMSVAFRNVARCVYYVLPDPAEYVAGKPERVDYRRLVFCEKANGGRIREPFGYRIANMLLPNSTVHTGAVVWDEAEVTCSLNDALAAADARPESSHRRGNLPQAVLQAALTIRDGWAPVKDLFAAGAVVGIPERTLQHARSTLELATRRIGFGKDSVVWWGLPGVPFPDEVTQ